MFAAEFLINKMAREYNETFMGVVTSLKEEIEFQDLIQSIEEKNIYKISAATKFEKFQQKLSQFKPLILSTINIAARETEKKKNILLDLDREVNLNEVNKVTTKFITGMAEQQKLVVQKIIHDGIGRQLSAKSIADKLINNIGLNAPQTEILQNLENNLINSNTNKATINKIIEQKSKQFLKTRAETIALTESANAISAGRYLMQQQMYDDGDISSDTTQEWYTASSERTCSVCAPMHGQKVKMNELFTTGSGSKVKSPILHARCRCIVVINF